MVFINNGDGTFERDSAVIPAGQEVIASDLNGDGKLDLAVSDSNSIYTVFGNGDGTFQTPVLLTAAASMSGLAAADFNGDGQLDFAVASGTCYDPVCLSNGSTSVLLGQGNGTFVAAVLYGASGSGPIATGDFNGDGKIDLATPSMPSDSVSVVLGNGDGTFLRYQDFPTGTHPTAVVAVDFNKDAKLDLAVFNHLLSSSVSILLGNGDGTFQPHVDYGLVIDSQNMTVGDFNGDGNPDLAVSALSSNYSVSVLLGNGDGTFQPRVPYSIGPNAQGIVAGDFNGDGKLDLAVSTGSGVSILLGNGDGTFQTATVAAAIGGPILAADFNKDGKLDLAVRGGGPGTVGTCSVLLGNGDGSFQPPVSYTIDVSNSGGGSLGGVGDFYGDGNLDLVTTAYGAITVFRGNGDGTFQKGVNYVFPDAIFMGLAAADLNADGNLDLALGGVGILLNRSALALFPTQLFYAGQPTGTTSLAHTVALSNPGVIPLTVSSVSITGTEGGDFAQTNNCSSVAVGSNCTINVTFSPTEMGVRTAALTITDNVAGSPQVIALMGSGTGPAPVVGLSPTRLAFGQQPVGTTTAAQTVTVINAGNMPLEIASIMPSTGYAQTSNCASPITPQTSCEISVTFTPSAVGTQDGTIAFFDNADDSPQIVRLSGTGIGPSASLFPTGLSFPTQLVGATSAAQTVTLSNTGNAALSILSIATSGAYAQTSDCGTSLAAGASCSISVTFTPMAAGAATGALTITDSASDSPHSISLTGTGTQPSLSLSSPSLSFGNQIVGTTSAAQTVTITNTGDAVLNIASFGLTGDVQDFQLPAFAAVVPVATVAPGANYSLEISFTPKAAGTRTGTFTITSDAPGSPHAVALSGTGTDFALGAGSGGSTSATVSAGAAATYNLSLAPGGFTGTATLACTWKSAKPRGANCALSSASVNLDGTNAAPFTVTVTTTRRATAVPKIGGHKPPLPPTGRHGDLTLRLWLLALAMLAAAAEVSGRRSRMIRASLLRGALAGTLLGALLWTACGGSGPPPPSPPPNGTPAGTYTLTVTATASGRSHTADLTLKVK